MTGEAAGVGVEGSDEESSRMEMAELTSGCAKRTNAGAGVSEEDMRYNSRAG